MSIEKIISSIPSKSEKEREQMRSRAEKTAATGSADAQLLLDALGQYEMHDRQKRIEFASSLPKAQLVIAAFATQPMTENERNVVQALLDNPGLTSQGLSEKLGWGGQIWQRILAPCARTGSDRSGQRHFPKNVVRSSIAAFSPTSPTKRISGR
ncbi:MAG: hypothetical protein E5W82_05315 [Mesorhizobium sp.]|nr:MAG: hypothetical protein E5W82_05315 [Mesorhizobium sp.]